MLNKSEIKSLFIPKDLLAAFVAKGMNGFIAVDIDPETGVLWQQAIDWLRNEKYIDVSYFFNQDTGFYEYRCVSTARKSPWFAGGNFDSSEEARQAAIEEVLKIKNL